MAKTTLIDTDIHPGIANDALLPYLPEPWRTRLATGNRTAGNLGYWNPVGVNRADAITEDGQRIESDPAALAHHLLDAYNIDFGILNPGSTLQLALSPEADYASALISATNDVLLDHWLPQDSRYRASLSVYANEPALAVREIERVGDHPGIVQVYLPSGARIPYGQRFYHPIYAAAQERGLPVAVHPGSEGVGISGPPTAVGYPSSYLEWHTGLLSSYVGHLTSLVTEGVFAKFPKLKFVLIEGGVSWLPPFLWRLNKNWKALRMTVPWVDRLPSEIVTDHVLLTTQPLEEPEEPAHFHAILEMFDAEQMLMFATDYPHWDGDMPDFAARAFPKSMRSRIMYKTACELYGLPQGDA